MFIKAIETSYKGYRFRSRLEARWAVFFDRVGLEYVYEMEGYEMEGIRYLPDFYLSHMDVFIEIKPLRYGKLNTADFPTFKALGIDETYVVPTGPEDEARRKACMLYMATGKCVYILCGEPYKDGDDFKYSGYHPHDDGYYWCACPGCGSLGIQYEGRANRNEHRGSCPVREANSRMRDAEYKVYGTDHPRLRDAYRAARSARFEF